MLNYRIESISFESNMHYLDVDVNNEEGFLILKIDTQTFDIEESDWEIIKTKIDELFLQLNPSYENKFEKNKKRLESHRLK